MRVVVLITNWALCAPVLRLGMGLLFPGRQVAPVGRAVLQESVTLPGKPLFALGVTVAVKTAGTPAGTVAVAGPTARLKSFTMVLPLAVIRIDPLIPAAPLFPKSTEPPGVCGATAVSTTVTVAVAEAFIVPILQRTVGGEPLGWPQLPGLAAALTKVAPEACKLSLNVTPLVKSPLLRMV